MWRKDRILDLAALIDGKLLERQPKITSSAGLIELLGPTKEIADLGDDLFIYKYDDWQLTYRNNKLEIICVYHRDKISQADMALIDVDIDQFYRYLNDRKLTWKIDERMNIPGQSNIIIESGCQVLIDTNTGKIDHFCYDKDV